MDHPFSFNKEREEMKRFQPRIDHLEDRLSASSLAHHVAARPRHPHVVHTLKHHGLPTPTQPVVASSVPPIVSPPVDPPPPPPAPVAPPPVDPPPPVNASPVSLTPYVISPEQFAAQFHPIGTAPAMSSPFATPTATGTVYSQAYSGTGQYAGLHAFTFQIVISSGTLSPGDVSMKIGDAPQSSVFLLADETIDGVPGFGGSPPPSVTFQPATTNQAGVIHLAYPSATTNVYTTPTLIYVAPGNVTQSFVSIPGSTGFTFAYSPN